MRLFRLRFYPVKAVLRQLIFNLGFFTPHISRRSHHSAVTLSSVTGRLRKNRRKRVIYKVALTLTGVIPLPVRPRLVPKAGDNSEVLLLWALP